MTGRDQIIFNLLFNSTCSFIAGIVIVFLSITLFRVDTNRWKLFFLSLPFIKIVWDILSGIPSTSFLFHSIDPFSLPAKHKYLMFGAGFSKYGPLINLQFSLKNLLDEEYSISAADFLYLWLSKTFTQPVPKILLLILLIISSGFVIFRLWKFINFEVKRRKDRYSSSCFSIETITLPLRKVDIYVSKNYMGTPFTGGLFQPYICVPLKTYELLDDEEQKAVILHEIAHIRNFDLPITMAIKVLGDIFWFVPGYRFLSKKIDRLREVLADKTAVLYGASPAFLAKALLKLKECDIDLRHAVLYSAFFKEKSLLKMRVQQLTETVQDQKRPRFGWRNRFIRILIVIFTTGGVLSSTCGGNHQVVPTPDWIKKINKKIVQFLE